jgi:hypothetical protein
LPVACCLLPVACCLVPVACCLLPVAWCLLPVACCLCACRLLVLRPRTSQSICSFVMMLMVIEPVVRCSFCGIFGSQSSKSSLCVCVCSQKKAPAACYTPHRACACVPCCTQHRTFIIVLCVAFVLCAFVFWVCYYYRNKNTTVLLLLLLLLLLSPSSSSSPPFVVVPLLSLSPRRNNI